MSKVIPIALLALIVGAIGYVVWTVFTSDELRSKPEWSALQNLEYLHRNEPLAGITFETDEQYIALGIPSKDGKTRIWILLNPKDQPFYKQLPEGDYTLTQHDYDSIKTRLSVQPQVLQQLSKHLKTAP